MEAGIESPAARRAVDDLVKAYKLPEPLYVTRPSMPPREAFQELLAEIWESRWLTNDGQFHQRFEARLAEYLGVEHVNLFCNGTLALLVALQALRINGGEVITTPFTFPATPHVLYWNKIRPVFCDIDPNTFNLDPDRVEGLISPDTRAILPVHVYGTPCDVESLQEIADRHGLHMIYDAAHTFGVRYKGRALASYGDISMLSFHATKLFSTLEGGALVVSSDVQKTRINFLKNFGIAGPETVIGPGINGKMNEFQAAYGLLQLDMIEDEIARRCALAARYREGLRAIPGITFLEEMPEVRHNYAYFPILVNAAAFGMNRDRLHEVLKEFNIGTRKYFHPLCSHYPCYAPLPSARPENLPVAERVTCEVLCLPLYGGLDGDIPPQICRILGTLHDIAVGTS